MAQKKGCSANSMARAKPASAIMTGELKGSHHDRLRLRWKKAEDLLQQLDELDFKDAVQAIRKQLASEKKWVDKKSKEPSSKNVVVVRKPQPQKSEEGRKKAAKDDDESETDESSSSSSEESAASSDEESSSSADEESEEEASSSSSDEEEAEEEDESSSDDEEADEESEKEEEIPQSPKTVAPPQQRGSRAPFKRVVSFSDRAHDVRLLSPKTESKDKLFYTRQDIERFRMEDRMRKTEEAQANLEAIIADARITMMGLSVSSY
jgi:cobalamin biosynthesis protein CobT